MNIIKKIDALFMGLIFKDKLYNDLDYIIEVIYRED